MTHETPSSEVSRALARDAMLRLTRKHGIERLEAVLDRFEVRDLPSLADDRVADFAAACDREADDTPVSIVRRPVVATLPTEAR